jgi:hypothetical protein
MKKSLRSGGARFGGAPQTLTAVRPAVEAAMLAAVAFGCAHAGWSLLVPTAQGAIDTSGAEEEWSEQGGERAAVAALVSPFAPDAVTEASASSAAAAFVSTVKVVSVRVSEVEARSGAIIALQDGGERAFLVGQTLSDGVVLSEVNAGGVVLTFAGGQRDISLAPATRHSFAAALLGRIDPPQNMALVVAEAGEPSSAALSTLTAVDAAAASPFMYGQEAPRAPSISVTPNVASTATDAAGAPHASSEVAMYLATLLAGAPDGRIPDSGLRLNGPLPAAIAAFGLQEGDTILAVNGGARVDLAALSALGTSQSIELTVQRASSEPMVLRAAMRSPA